MEDRFGKYLRLFGSILFLLLGFLVSVILILVLLRVIFGLMSYIPLITYAYMIFILLVPSLLFITCYIIYFKRTKSHPKVVVRWISYVVFAAALAAWCIFLVKDAIIFYKHAYNAIGMYYSYNMIFLSLNVAAFFLVGVLQALSMEKEVDWMERAEK
jgi:hypothetical protein